jgi:hypothetical protein
VLKVGVLGRDKVWLRPYRATIYIYMKGKCIKNKELKKILKGYISKKIVARHI